MGLAHIYRRRLPVFPSKQIFQQAIFSELPERERNFSPIDIVFFLRSRVVDNLRLESNRSTANYLLHQRG